MKQFPVKPDYSIPFQLLRGLEKGDEQAYMYLVEHYYERLYDYARNLSRDAYRADDIVQNVFIRLWEKRANLKNNISLKSYLHRAVYNEFVDLYRRDVATTTLEKKYVEEMDVFLQEDDGSQLERLVQLVKQEIQQLPPKCRETFLLSRKEGLSYLEIAEYLKVSPKTVDNHMNNAFRILRKKVGEKVDMFLFFLFGPGRKVVY